MNRLLLQAAALLLVLLVVGATPATAIDIHPDDHYFGIKVGLLAPGEAEISKITYDTEAGASFGLFYDFAFMGSLQWGFAADFHRVSLDRSEGDDPTETFVDLSAHLKLFLGREGGRFAFRPGVALGFGTMSSVGVVSNSNYFTTKAMAEILFAPDLDFGFIGAAEVLYTPSGSSDQFDVSLGPVFVFRLGIVY